MATLSGSPEHVVVVHLTSACNLRCAYCFQRDKQPRALAWTPLRHALEWMLASATRTARVAFTGGEPLLQFDLMARAVVFVEHERPRDLPITFEILTNGLLLGDETVAFLADHDVHLSLSMDGRPPSQDLRGRGTFAKLDRLLARLKQERPFLFERRLKIAMTVCRETVPFLADSVEYLVNAGLATIAITPAMTPDNGWTDADTAELERQFAEIYRHSLAYYERTGNVPLQLFRRGTSEPLPGDGSGTPCTIGDGHALALDVAGRAVPCPLFSQGYHTPGSPLLDEAAAVIAQVGCVEAPGVSERIVACGERLHALPLFGPRREKRSSWGRCADCQYLGRCFVCPVSIGLIPGNTDPSRVPDFECAFTRVSLAWRDRFPAQPSLQSVRRSLDRFWASVHGRTSKLKQSGREH